MSSKRGHLVYALIDPRSGAPFYVGRSSTGTFRARQHWAANSMKRWAHLPVTRALAEILAVGLEPRIQVLERLDGPAELNAREKHWIAHYRTVGLTLTNVTSGGGGSCGWVPPAEWRRKISEANKGKVYSAETLRKMSEAHKGYRASPETCKKISEIKKRQSEETRQKIGRAVAAYRRTFPRALTQETKARIAEAVRNTLARKREVGSARA